MKRKSQDYSVWSVLDPSLLCNDKNDRIHKMKDKEDTKTTYLDYFLPEYEQEFTTKFMPPSPASSICYNNTFITAANTAQKEPKKRSLFKDRSFRHLGSPFTETETSSEDGDTIATKEKEKDENAALLQACLDEVENIEKELLFHRNSIYREKLENLEKELLSIELYQHNILKKEDKKQEKIRDKRLNDAKVFRNAQLEALNKKFHNDIEVINRDAQVSEDNIKKAITSSIPSHHHNHKRLKSNQEVISTSATLTADKPPSPLSPGAISPISSMENPTSIAIKKKMSTFQAIEERKKTIYSMKEISKKAFVNDDESDLEGDLIKMRKKITQ